MCVCVCVCVCVCLWWERRTGGRIDRQKESKGRRCSLLPDKYLRSLLWNGDAVRDRHVSAPCVCVCVCVCVCLGDAGSRGRQVRANSSMRWRGGREGALSLFVYLPGREEGGKKQRKEKRGRERKRLTSLSQTIRRTGPVCCGPCQ